MLYLWHMSNSDCSNMKIGIWKVYFKQWVDLHINAWIPNETILEFYKTRRALGFF